MSTTSVYELFKTKVNCIDELHNGHGSGPAIWDYVSLKVFDKKFSMFDPGEFWSSYKSDKLYDFEKAVLLSTYDNAYIEIDHLIEFAEACKKVHAMIINTTDWEWNHFKDIGVAAEKLHIKHDHRCIGLAIGCTSVCDRWEQGDIDEIQTWGVYTQIEELKQ